MRKGFDGLYGLVRDQLGQDPLSGHLFLFSNHSRSRLKILVWDGSRLWVCAKRLETGEGALSLAQRAGGALCCDAAGGIGDAHQWAGHRRRATAQELAAAHAGSIKHFFALGCEKARNHSPALGQIAQIHNCVTPEVNNVCSTGFSSRAIVDPPGRVLRERRPSISTMTVQE
jgi:hypothetical protein